jgi:hypothetical protein
MNLTSPYLHKQVHVDVVSLGLRAVLVANAASSGNQILSL